MGTGKVTVEHLGLKDCPRCEGTGDIEAQQPMNGDPSAQLGGDPNAQGIQQAGGDPNGGQPPQNPVEQQPNGGGQDTPPPQQPNGGQPPQQGQQPQPTFTEPSEDAGQPVQNMAEPQQEQPLQQKQQTDKSQQSNLERPYEQESLKKKLYECNGTSCPKSIKQYEGFIKRKIQVLQNKRRGKSRAVEIMFGLPTINKNGKKIKGLLAYAGVSLNNRIYLPEELAKGHGKTLPLLLNHSNEAGAEEELDRLDEEMRDHLSNGKDFQIGWVTLRWEPEELTLYYEGVIEHEFFQKEVDDADMAVSLGIWYDSDSPQVCDEECYTMIRGAEFREVSLVYHPGFPIATIEAVEVALRVKAKKQIASEANMKKYDHYIKNMDSAIEVGSTNYPWFNTSGTAITTPSFAGERHYPLQPKMSLPKTTGELKIPPNPKVVKPEDSVKDKKKGDEDVKKKLKNKTTLTNLREVVKVDNSQLKGHLHKLE